MSSLSELRQQYQDKQGGQTTDATSVARQNRVIQNVCRELFPKIPDQWFRQTWEIRLEAPVDLTAYYGQIYQETTGPSRFIYFGTLPASSGYIAIGATVLATDGTLSNRWLQVYRASDQKYIYRKIRQVVTYVSGIFTFRGVVMDEPWENTTDADLSCKILTLEYPLPGDVTRIRGLRWSTDGAYGGRSLMFGNGPTTMDVLRLGSTLSTGIPSVAGLASTHRIQAPHWTPVMAVGNGQSATAKWGFTAAGVERDSAASGAQYGAAGTFSYRSCIVWGRRPWLHPTKGWGFLGPWVMSPPTKASNQVTTTWGAGMVTGTLANIEYLHGFVNGSDSPCKDAAGLEHWVFRARHATEDPASASNHAAEKYLEADGAYYLWNIFPGSVSSFTDRGDADPADIAFPLKDYSPQSSLSFDVIASEATTLNASVIVRPRVATADEDTIEIPDGFDEIIMNRMVYYFQARRDADRGFMKDLDDTYMKLILELRRQSPFTPDVGAGAEFGNGLSTIDEWPTLWGPLRVIP